MNSTLSPILDQQSISRIRRNHGLEHATIHVLTQKQPRTSLAGHSDTGGFWILGDVPTEAVQEAAQEALDRMRGGEGDLAVHPNCGTNFVAAGSIAGILAAAVMIGVGNRWRDRLERLPLAMSLATMALIFAQPIGTYLQKHVTTSGEPGEMEIVAVNATQRGRLKAHRVVTRG